MSAVLPADHVTSLSGGIAARYARTLRAIDRLDALDGRSGPIASEELRDDPDAAAAIARELVARLLAVAADARLAPLLRAVVTGGGEDGGGVGAGTRIVALAAGLGASRLVVVRRADDLVDVGLAVRDIEHDTLAATALGVTLVAFLDEVEGATAAELSRR